MGSDYRVATVLSSEKRIDIFSNKYVTCRITLLHRAFQWHLFPKVVKCNIEDFCNFCVGNNFVQNL
jgi:hypothetical protein